MQPTQKLTSVLRRLLELVEDEAQRNPTFASQLAEIMAPLPSKRQGAPRQGQKPRIEVPDVILALREKGQEEFSFWLRSFDVPTLKAIIKSNGFDVAKASRQWTDPDKLIALVVEQAMAQLRRGSSFLTQGGA